MKNSLKYLALFGLAALPALAVINPPVSGGSTSTVISPGAALGSNYFFVRATAPSPGPEGTYNPPVQQSGEGILIETSADTINWRAISSDGAFQYTASPGLRDPSIMFDDATRKFYVCATRQASDLGVAARSFAVISSSNLIHWSAVATVQPDTTTATSIIWSPEWFRANGTNYVVYTHHDYSAPGDSARIEVVAVRDSGFTSWSGATIIATNLDTSQGLLDPMVIRNGSLYYLFTKNEGLDPGNYLCYTNRTFPGTTGGFRLSHTATTFEAEGASGILKIGNSWRFFGAYLSGPNAGEFFYSDSATFGHWTTQVKCYETPRSTFGQGTVLPVDNLARFVAYNAAENALTGTNINHRGSFNARQVSGITLVTSNSIVGYTNAQSTWPTVAPARGAWAIVTSNHVVYLLTSTPGSTTWAATNKLGP